MCSVLGYNAVMSNSTSDHVITSDTPKRLTGRGGGGRLTPFTPETARLAAKAREEKRIRLYTAGAGRAVQNKELIREFGEDAHIVERGITLQEIATTPDAGKAAVMAAAQLDKAQGLTPDRAERDDAPAASLTLTLDPAVSSAIARLLQLRGADVVDVEAEDVE